MKNVDVRVDDEVTRIVTVVPNVVVPLDVNRTADDDNLDDSVRAEVVFKTEVDDYVDDVFSDDGCSSG